MVDRIVGKGRPIQITVPERSTVIVIQQTSRGNAVHLESSTEQETIMDPNLLRAVLQDFMQFGAEDIDMGISIGKLLVQLKHARHIFSYHDFQRDLNKNLEEAKDAKEGATHNSMPGIFISFKKFLEAEAIDIWTEPDLKE